MAGAVLLEGAPGDEAGARGHDRRAGRGEDVLALVRVAGPPGAEPRLLPAERVRALHREDARGGGHGRRDDLDGQQLRGARAAAVEGRRPQAGGVAAGSQLRPPRRRPAAAGPLPAQGQRRRGPSAGLRDQVHPHAHPPRPAADPVADRQRRTRSDRRGRHGERLLRRRHELGPAGLCLRGGREGSRKRGSEDEGTAHGRRFGADPDALNHCTRSFTRGLTPVLPAVTKGSDPRTTASK